MRITEGSLQRPVTVFMGVLALIILGAVSVTRLPLEFLPQKDFPFVGVWVPYYSSISVPSQAEKEITRPIEEVLATLGDVKETRSFTDWEECFVGVMFEFGRDVDVLRLDVKEKLDQVRPLLPDEVRDLYIVTFNTNDIPVMVGRISSEGRDLASSYDLLDRHVVQPLKRVPGVGQVRVDGVRPAEVTIYLMIDRIMEHGIDVERLFSRVAEANLNLTLGRVTMDGDRYSVRAVGEFDSVHQVENLIVDDAGLRLKHVAEVVYDEPLPSFRRRLNGEAAIAFEIQRASGANIVELSRNVRKALDEIGEDPALEGIDVRLFFDQAEQITGSLDSLLKSGLIGSLLALGVLYVFLRRLSTTLVVSVAIPFSIVSACVFLYLAGKSLNVLTMMGLMLATGMLVDNAIVVLESIHRRQIGNGNPVAAATLGTREVGRAVIAATLTSICVFAPVVLTPGDELAVWLGEVGATIIVTLSFSLLISLTLVPLLMGRFVPAVKAGNGRRKNGKHDTDGVDREPGSGSDRVSDRSGMPGFLVRLRDRYVKALDWTAIRHPFPTLGIVFGLLLLTALAIKLSGFSPQGDSERGARQEELTVRVEFKDNRNIYGAEEFADRMEKYLLAQKDSMGVESVYTYYTDNYLVSRLYFAAGEASERQMKALRQKLRDELPPLPGAEYRFSDEDEQGGAGGPKRITVTLFGEDTEYLGELSGEVKRRLATVKGVEEIETDLDGGKEEIQVRLRPEDAGRFGVSPRTMAQILNLTFRGVTISEFKGQDREVPVGIVLEPSDRRNIDNLKSMVVSRIDGQDIHLAQVADFAIERGPTRIMRENRRTALPITAIYEGEDYDDAVDEVESLMSSMDLPEGYAWSFGRELIEARQQVNTMLINILLALACVYLVMASLFESLIHPLVIMTCIPFALLGVFWMCIVTGTPFNILAMIGVVILIGVVVNNGIILIDHVNMHRREGKSREEAILLGGRERFRPILMTALTTILGLLPLAVGKASIGDGYYYPMARAVMAGLAVSTLLTLLVLPTFYVLAERGVLWWRRIAWKARGELPRHSGLEEAGTGG